MRLLHTVFVILALLPLQGASAAGQYNPVPWQQKAAQELPRIFGKIRQAHWSQDISLWLAVKRDNTNWESASHMICNALDGAGRPPGAFVALSFLDADAIRGNRHVVLAKAHCQPRPATPSAVDTNADEPDDLGIMGDDGVLRKDQVQ